MLCKKKEPLLNNIKHGQYSGYITDSQLATKIGIILEGLAENSEEFNKYFFSHQRTTIKYFILCYLFSEVTKRDFRLLDHKNEEKEFQLWLDDILGINNK